MKTYQDPFKTTIKGIKNPAHVRLTIRAIQTKLFEQGIISDQEEQYLRQHTDYGQIDQKNTFS
jgi:hypothetical protein